MGTTKTERPMVKLSTAQLLRSKLVEAARVLSDLVEEISNHESWAKTDPKAAAESMARMYEWPQYQKAEKWWMDKHWDEDELEKANLISRDIRNGGRP